MEKKNFNEMVIYDFSNLKLQQEGNDNCYNCDQGCNADCYCDGSGCD